MASQRRIDAADDGATSRRVWAVLGDEGAIYGLAATEAEAWEFVAQKARQGVFECSDRLPDTVTSPDEVQLYWQIGCWDGHGGRTLSCFENSPRAGGSVWGNYYLELVDLPPEITVMPEPQDGSGGAS